MKNPYDIIRTKLILKKLPKWYGEGREFTRTKVRARDLFQCQECKKRWRPGWQHFDIHHKNGECGKKSRAYDPVSKMDTLITLCKICHFKRHDRSKSFHKPKIEKKDMLKRKLDVKKMANQGISYKEIGKKYNISTAMVSFIVNDKKG